MKTFFDASAFAKRYIEEKGSHLVDALCQDADELAISVICIPEIISALNRRLREHKLSHKDYQIIKQAISDDVRDILVVNLTEEVLAASLNLLEKHTLRAMDALHVACALEWGAGLFVSSDKQQITAAGDSGLNTQYIL